MRQAISLRISEATEKWFKALAAGQSKVNPPGPVSSKRFRSFTYPQYGISANIKNGVLHLAKLGDFKVHGWRRMRGKKKSITIKWKNGHWWAIVLCEIQEQDVCQPYHQAVAAGLEDGGLDPGIAAVLTDSQGRVYETPKPLKKAQAKLRHVQKGVSRQFEARKKAHTALIAETRRVTGSAAPVAEGLVPPLSAMPLSNRLKKGIAKLGRVHTKVTNIRDDTAKKVARKIEQRFSRAAVEEHGLTFMFQDRRMSKAAADVAIGKQKQALKSALGSGRYHLATNRRPEGGNSQTCLCGACVQKTLGQRWHECPECGLSCSRDRMSAIICQYETFGSVPNTSEPGLGGLGAAVTRLKQRRGETNDKLRESVLVRPEAIPTVEVSMKRPALDSSSMIQYDGRREVAPSIEAKTVGHGELVSPSWPIDAEGFVARKTRVTRLNNKELGSSLLQVGE